MLHCVQMEIGMPLHAFFSLLLIRSFIRVQRHVLRNSPYSVSLLSLNNIERKSIIYNFMATSKYCADTYRCIDRKVIYVKKLEFF